MSIPNDIFLYADPGSGALLLQLIIGFVLGALFYVSVALKRVRQFLLKIFNAVIGRRRKTGSSENGE